ncbi:MAG: hypothetical protein K8U57_37245 [Planctomycetes bacterium]|nr:hypothetical protein [Planctomycetota bacterium]
MTASLERNSRHPLAGAILDAAQIERVRLLEPSNISEPPGRGLVGTVSGRSIRVTGRTKLTSEQPDIVGLLH